MNRARFYIEGSKSNPKKTYKVVEDVRGEWHCSCPSFAFGGRNFECKHIRGVKRRIYAANIIDCACMIEGKRNPIMTHHSEYECRNDNVGVLKA